MIEEIFYVLWQMIKMLLIGLWKLFKLTIKFFYEHTRYLFLVIVLLIALFYNYVTILINGNDIQIAKPDLTFAEQLADQKISLVGGIVDPGNFSLGPAYNLIATPAIWFGGYKVGGMERLGMALNVGTVLLLFLSGKRFFSYQAGIFAGGLYAVSSLVFSYAYGSWRLDILPFFVLMFMHVIFNASASARPFMTNLAAGIILGICLQLHYAALFLGLFTLAYCLGTNIILFRKQFFKPVLRQYLSIGVGLLLVSGPFLFSEARNGFEQTLALFNFLIKSVPNMDIFAALQHYARLVAHYPALIESEETAKSQSTALGVFAGFLAIASFAFLLTVRNSFIKLLISLWVGLGVIFLTLFSKTIFEYHFSPLYPVFFLLIGNVLGTIYHMANQDRVKMAKQLISSNAEGETYTMIPVDVTDNKKLALHYFCVTMSVLIFLLIFAVNFLPLFLPNLLEK